MNEKIIVVVKDGKILSARGSTPDVDFRVLDWDNLDSSDDQTRMRAEKLDAEYQEMHPIW